MCSGVGGHDHRYPVARGGLSVALHPVAKILARDRERVREKEDTLLPAYILAVLNLDSEAVDVDSLAVDLRPVFQKDLVCTRRYGRKQEAVAVGLGEIAILRSKRNLSIDARSTIE